MKNVIRGKVPVKSVTCLEKPNFLTPAAGREIPCPMS